MGFSSMAGFGFLLALPVLIAQWIGVFGLRKSAGPGGWWTMLVGTALSSLGFLGMVISIILMATSQFSGSGAPSGIQSVVVVMLIVSGISGLGSLVFAVGFAIHGLRSKREVRRIAELESVIAAQSEKLSREDPGTARA